MKKLVIFGIVALILVIGLAAPVIAAQPDGCTRIQDGVLTYPAGHCLAGQPLQVGYDIFGYNYQAHMFSGYYANAYLGRDGFPPYEGDTEAYLEANPGAASNWYWPYRDVQLVMKWNDAWLSNKSCDGDLLLDRHYGYDSYIGSGAWETNHQWGSYNEKSVVDEVNIGDLESEAGHNLEGWSDPWDWGGYYGGGDDGTLRLLMGPGDGCGDGYRDAYFAMDTQGAVADKVILHHLDGSHDDDFDIYVLDYVDEFGVEYYTLIGSYESQGAPENWVTTEYVFSPRSGEIKFKLVATGTVTGWCSRWGQVALSWAQLEGTCYWDYFCKIIAVPADAVPEEGIWYTADGMEIGPSIWGEFAIIQSVYNDPYGGYEGIEYLSPAGPGLGKW
jgi:hypothetical protein